MKKNVRSCIEEIPFDESLCLLDMNLCDRIEQYGFAPDLRHNRSAHMTAAWRFSEHSRAGIALSDADLSLYKYLTFSVFSVQGAGGSFSLQLVCRETGEEKNFYEITLPVTHDGWNDYRVYLPFLRTVGEPQGRAEVNWICFDNRFGGQGNRTETVLYVDNLFVWSEYAPPLYSKMPELKGAAAFCRTGSFSIIDRRRIPNAIDGSEARLFEEKGTLWLPMATVAGGIAHAAVVDNVANTLAFTYRRKKYFFVAEEKFVTVNGEREPLSFAPVARDGALFFPLEYVKNFFRWRQTFVDPMGLIVLSNRRSVFTGKVHESTVRELIADMTFARPDADRILADMHRRFPNSSRGRLLASFDDLMKLRRSVKTEPQLSQYVTLLSDTYGKKSDEFLSEPITGNEKPDLLLAVKRLWAFTVLYRVSGDKVYCERARAEAEAMAQKESWELYGASVLGEISLAMALAYDWCRHVWTEGQKATLERAIVRLSMRVGVDTYAGNRRMWQAGNSTGALFNAGMLAVSIALYDAYPETARKLLADVLLSFEECFMTYAPDGGAIESVSAWERGTRATALAVAMLSKACGSDYGLASTPGWRSTASFSIYAETANGVWNYHDCAAGSLDTSILPFFTLLTGDPLFAWMRRQQILSMKKTVDPLDVIFFSPVEEKLSPRLPLDAVWKRAGLAIMRSGWQSDANVIALHGGSNCVQDADLDAGNVLLEMSGERFFCETGGETALPFLLRRRAEGQNTVVIDPTEAPLPDQNPDACASLIEMRSDAQKAYAIVDMTSTNDLLLRAKRGAMLMDGRSVAVIQDEMTVSAPTTVEWSVWTRADVVLNKSGRTAKLTQNGKTLLCKLGGVGSPARFETVSYLDGALTRIVVRLEVKERLRMFVACKLLKVGESTSQKLCENLPLSRWCGE